MDIDEFDELCNDFVAAGRWLRLVAIIIVGGAAAIVLLKWAL